MLQHLKHHFRLGVPLIAFTAAVVFALSVGGLIVELASAPEAPSSRTVQILGDGLDEFSTMMSASLGALAADFDQYGFLITAIALCATAITVASSVRRLSRWVQGPSDIGALTQHILERGRKTIGVSAVPVSWGVVHDAQTGHPLPLATVQLLDDRGSVLASSVADTAGRYGFLAHLNASDALRASTRFHVRKDGYYFAHRIVAVTTGLTRTYFDIPLQKLRPAGDVTATEATHGSVVAVHAVEHVAFWSALVSVPVSYASSPSLYGVALMVLLGLALIIRAVETRRHVTLRR